MEYRFLAATELGHYLSLFSFLLIVSFLGIFMSSVFKKWEKLFIGSVLLGGLSFMCLIGVSNTNVYSDTFSRQAVLNLRYEMYGGVILAVIILISTLVYWRRGT